LVNPNCNLLWTSDEIKRGRLHPAEKLGDVGCSPIDSADKFTPHHAVAIDDVGFGKFEGTVERVALLVGVAHRKQIDVVFFEELQVGILVDVDADGEHRDAFCLHPPLHFYQRGISSTQGGHQVAQKFSTTTCPRKSLSFTERAESWTVNSGAVEPMRSGRDPV